MNPFLMLMAWQFIFDHKASFESKHTSGQENSIVVLTNGSADA
jgi:hypothetical protein